MNHQNWKKQILTIPNLLSLVRLIFIPIYVVIYLNASAPKHYYWAGGILTVSCLTDLLDGQIARRFDMVTNLGKILDPLADKVTQFSLILCLSSKYPILWFVVILFILKETFQLIAGLVTLQQGKMLTGALLSGKLCTVVLFTSLIVMVFIPTLTRTAQIIIAAADGLFMLIAFIDYIQTYIKQSAMIQSLDLDGQ